MKTTLFLITLCPLLIAAGEPSSFKREGSGWLNGPVALDVSTANEVMEGMSKRQVYHILGAPHFSEGLGAKRWNYAFALRRSASAQATACQLQISYQKARVTKMIWNDERCPVAGSQTAQR
jgi:OmpA-OmpF porin, OOP family